MTNQTQTNEDIIREIHERGDRNGERVLLLLNRNAGFIRNVCKPFLSRRLIEREEEPQIAFIAMCSAVERCKLSDVPFLTLLRYALLDELAKAVDDNSVVSIPENLRLMLIKYMKFKRDFEQRTGRTPLDDEIKRALRISNSELALLRTAEGANVVVSLDLLTDADNKDTLSDFIVDTSIDVEYTGTQALLVRELRAALDEIMQSLPEDQRQVVILYFFEEKSMKEIATCTGHDLLAVKSDYHHAMYSIRKPVNMRKLSRFLESENLYTGNGFSNFERTWTTAPERAVIHHIGEDGNRNETTGRI